ncbi:MAG: hypothetical protein OXD45_08525 [Rhodobacteraceae bacterium]|nr:hypothetical protein [Paracoccaceae bacterium]
MFSSQAIFSCRERNNDHKKFVEQWPGTFQEPTEAIVFLTGCRSWHQSHVEGGTDIHCQRLQQAAGMTGFGGWDLCPEGFNR